jgi:RNA polymerase sigma-70 factor (ECF subfamily)
VAELTMTRDNDKEQELAGRIARGDKVAMREFYYEYSGYLASVCRRYIGRPDDAKDVFGECLVKIFGSIARFEYRGVGSLRAWSGRIAANESLKWLKKHKWLKTATLPDEIASAADDGDEYPDFSNIPAAAITEMISTLPDGYRTVFNLYVFEHKSHREIGSMLGIAENSSSSQFHRARRMLAKRIKEYEAKK